ncbi:hypothetical protein PFISCL1PPCAC_26686, partial [Pristionchus fissidentatus]
EETEEEQEMEEDEQGKESSRYSLVETHCLLELIERCKGCGERLDSSLIRVSSLGSAKIVTYDCLPCNKTVRWESQSRVGKGKGQVYKGNHDIPVASFITGTPLPRLCDFAKLIDLSLPSDRAMRRVIREVGESINRVYASSEARVRKIAVAAAGGKGLEVSIDGQYDTPGYNAANCKVTAIDCNTKLALGAATLHKKEHGIDNVSIRMESEGTLRILEELIDDGISISTRVGDQNLMVNKALRENDKTAGILGMLDWWHVQKPFRKEWKKVVKANPELAPVYQSFFNHLYYTHNKFPNHEDRSRALELVRSFEHHIQGKHSWAKDKRFTMVKKCAHGRLRKLKKGETRLKLTKEVS